MHSETQAQNHWLSQWFFCAVATCVGFLTWSIGQRNDLVCLVSCLAWLVALVKFTGGWESWDTRAAFQKLRRKATEEREDKGEARWATWDDDVKHSGLNSKEGVYIGELGGHTLRYGGENSGLSV